MMNYFIELRNYIYANLWAIFLLINAFALIAIEQIVCNNVETWLPWWVTTGQNWFGLPEIYPFKIIDGFHLFKGLGLLLLWLSYRKASWRMLLTAWIAGWIIFDIFYHVVFPINPTTPFIFSGG